MVQRALTTILGLAILLFAVVGCARKETASRDWAELESLAGRYEIEIVAADVLLPAETAHGTIDGKAADPAKLHEYVPLFVAEFSLYPVELVRRSKLKRVVLCSELSFAGQLRGAVPAFDQDTLYLDVSRGAHNTTYLRKTIHHDFFHVIDYRDDGSVYGDTTWAALNPPPFKYGDGGRAAQHLPNSSVLTDAIPGFLNYYSTTGVEEDKAEVFANLLVDSEYVERRAQTDRVLDAKVNRMKQLLAAFCPAMNEEFWSKVGTTKRP